MERRRSNTAGPWLRALATLAFVFAVTPAAPASAASPRVKTVVRGVPTLDFRSVPAKEARAGRKGWADGNALLKEKRYGAAADVYIEALGHDPGNIYARYNLGCAFALGGDRARALGILRQFKEEDCIVCRRRLQRATKDRDFAEFWRDPEFRALTRGITIEEPDYTKEARRLERKLSRSSLDGTFAAGRDVRVVYTATLSGPDEKERSARVFYDKPRFLAYMDRLFTVDAEAGESPGVGGWRLKGLRERWKCELQSVQSAVPCCEVDSRALCDGSEDFAPLTRVCFWPESPTAALPIELGFAKCGYGGVP